MDSPSIPNGIAVKDHPLVNNLLDEIKNIVVVKEVIKENYFHATLVENDHEKMGNADSENVKKTSIMRSIKAIFFRLR